MARRFGAAPFFIALVLGGAFAYQQFLAGVVLREYASPAALTYKEDGAETIRKAVRQAAVAVKLPWKETATLVLRR